jgi:hypothetical protein
MTVEDVRGLSGDSAFVERQHFSDTDFMLTHAVRAVLRKYDIERE